MSIKLITLNVWKGVLLPALVSFFRKEAADLLCLQEVFDGPRSLPDRFRAHSILARELGYPYSAFAAECLYDLEMGRIPHGNAIYSRFPLTEEETIFYDVPFRDDYVDSPGNYEFHPRNLQHVRLDGGGVTLDVFNTHGIYGLTGKDNQRRLRMSRMIVHAIKGKARLILAGDFNLPPDTQTIRNIEKHFRNVFQDALVTTFNMKRKEDPDYGKVVVDMIFTSRNIRILRRSSPKVDISDHLPLVCELEV